MVNTTPGRRAIASGKHRAFAKWNHAFCFDCIKIRPADSGELLASPVAQIYDVFFQWVSSQKVLWCGA